MRYSDDISGKAYEVIHREKIRIIGRVWTMLMYAWCKIFNIPIQSGNVFYGRTRFRRFYKGEIKIGSKNRFASIRDRNVIALTRPCYISAFTSGKLSIGSNCGFSGTVIAAYHSISIGDNVKFGANCLIMDYEGHSEDSRSGKPLPINIEDNVWLGTNVVVLKGVTIGRNTLIGANSLVTRDIPANAVAAGSPCKVIRLLEEHATESIPAKAVLNA